MTMIICKPSGAAPVVAEISRQGDRVFVTEAAMN